ncbi:MAG: hypothetical protein Q8L08_10500, partial [Candidatus Nanopelagicaceae bacterium]|nr:hypothetical protein [Candidatus Nanopelagicaceae bacterium]
ILSSSGMANFSIQRITSMALFSALALPILFTPQSHAATSQPKEPKAACRIEVDNAHISTSLLRQRKLKYVKVNARSICNVPQQRVTLTVEIYKTGFFSDHFVDRFKTEEFAPQSSSLRVKISNAAVECKNNEMTRYFGIAYAKAIIQGKWQYAGRTRSDRIIPLHCGT